MSGLVVRSLNAVLPYRDSLTSPDTLGRRLDATWLVGGRVYRIDSLLVASVSLTESVGGRLLGRTEARAPAGQYLTLLEELVPQVAILLRERIGEEVRLQAWRAGTRSSEALAALNRAHIERNDGNKLAARGDRAGALLRLRRADSLLARAAAVDTRWPEPAIQRALVALNAASIMLGGATNDDSTKLVMRRGIKHAESALAADSASTRAREVLGTLLHMLAGLTSDRVENSQLADSAERVLRSAIDSDPTLVDALTLLSTIHFGRGEYAEAYVLAERAYAADAYYRQPQELLNRLFMYAFEAEEDLDAAKWCREYNTAIREDWFGGFCRLSLMIWVPGITANADSAVATARYAIAAAPRVIRPVVAAQVNTLLAAALHRAGAKDSARATLASVTATATREPFLTRGPFVTELLEISAAARLAMGQRDSAVSLARALLSREPERAVRLQRSRRFRDISAEITQER
jgi:tetratricopeptide (TPR) repeat protein